MAAEARRPSPEPSKAGRRASEARSRSGSHAPVATFCQNSWDNLLERLADREKLTTASVRVTRVDNDRTRLLKEVLNCAAKAMLGSRRSVPTAAVMPGAAEHPGAGPDALQGVHKVEQRYESVRGVPLGAGGGGRSGTPAPQEEGAAPGPPGALEDDAVLSVAAGVDPALKGVLAYSGQRIAGLTARLERASKPAVRQAPQQAPGPGPDVVLVSWGGAARQGHQQRLEETADQLIDKFIQFEPLDALEAVCADGADRAALARAFPGRSPHNPALVRLTDYLLERPEEFHRATQRVDSTPSFTVKERTMRHVGSFRLEGRPSAMTVRSTSSEAAEAAAGTGAPPGQRRPGRPQPEPRQATRAPRGTLSFSPRPMERGSRGSAVASPPGAPRAKARGLIEGHKLFRDLSASTPASGTPCRERGF